MTELSIGEVAELAGVTTSTLRYYEDIHLIKPYRRINGRRRYRPDILSILAVIQLAKDANFTLDEIHELLHGFSEDVAMSERWCAVAKRKIVEIDNVIREVQATKALLEESLTCSFLHFEMDDHFNPSE
jgi:DNA-binding transcriptional MerR regulator